MVEKRAERYVRRTRTTTKKYTDLVLLEYLKATWDFRSKHITSYVTRVKLKFTHSIQTKTPAICYLENLLYAPLHTVFRSNVFSFFIFGTPSHPCRPLYQLLAHTLGVFLAPSLTLSHNSFHFHLFSNPSDKHFGRVVIHLLPNFNRYSFTHRITTICMWRVETVKFINYSLLSESQKHLYTFQFPAHKMCVHIWPFPFFYTAL